jgi:hypothetical protein
LYIDERRYERTASYAKLKTDLETLADRIAEIPLEELRPYRAAAE